MRRKLFSTITAILLSAAMIMEPVGTEVTAHAAEYVEGQTDAGVSDAEPEDGTASESQKPDEESVAENDTAIGEEATGGEKDAGDAAADGEESHTASEGEVTGGEAGDSTAGEANEDSEAGETAGEANEDSEAGETAGEANEDSEAGETAGEANEDSEAGETNDISVFSSMPDNYVLTNEQIEMKQALAESMSRFDEEGEGTIFAESEVITFADSQEEAELIAQAYHAELLEYELGVATMQLEEDVTVGMALTTAASRENNLPAVYANYYRHATFCDEPVTAPVTILNEVTDQVADEAVCEAVTETTDVVTDSGQLTVTEEEYTTDSEASDEASDEARAEENTESSAYEYAITAYADPYLLPSSPYYQWQHINVGSVYAWKNGYQGQGVKVAVLDSGVTPISGELEVAASISTVDNLSSTTDGQGHGTHVAGIIGARSNTTHGVGIAPQATLYNVKVLNDSGSGTDADIIKGIQKAIDWDVDIINLSLGGVGYNPAFQEMVDEAYEAGIAIFAAAGNDGGSNMMYPAAYDHVICVAATDSNHARAYFSNYGSWVDLSAPGVDIYSTSKSGISYVACMSGTSQACPVAAGEAAVILSAELPELRDKTGSARVDALESLMKKNAVSAGSGMGKGITSLTKVFGIKTAAEKPAAPVITAQMSENAQSVTITITASAGTTVYYRTDGKTPVYQAGSAGTGTEMYTSAITLSEAKKGTVSAIAVNESGAVSSVKKLSFTLKPYVTGITVSGVSRIAKGKASQLSATVGPNYASDKSVIWSIAHADGTEVTKADGVSISKTGKVTATRNAVAGDYTVTVQAKDDGQAKTTYHITVIESVKISSVKFKSSKLTLELPTDTIYNLGEKLVIKTTAGQTADVSDFNWTSSNAKAVTVDNHGMINPVGAGKATITATANDSSGKKETCIVTVKQLATNVTVSGGSQVARGKKLTFKASVTPDTTSNKKVTWKVTDQSGATMTAKANGISVSASGVVSVTGKANAGTYTVTATAADGSGVSSSKKFTVKTGAITSVSLDQKKATIFRVSGSASASTQVTITATLKGTDGFAADAYTCTSSNPGIATVSSVSGTNGTVTIKVKATGKAAGKTTITLAATDGSNKKASCMVTVNNPVSRIMIAPPAGANRYVARGKSLALKATVETEYGSVSGKGVTWKLYLAKITSTGKITITNVEATAKTYGVSISSSGKVTAKNTAIPGIYAAVATAKDGSGVCADYTINVTEGTKTLLLQDYLPYYGYYSLPTGYTYNLSENKAYYLRVSADTDLPGGVSVTSSSPQVLSGMVVKEDGDYYVFLVADKKGTATITVQALDGSGKKVKYKFKVTD